MIFFFLHACAAAAATKSFDPVSCCLVSCCLVSCCLVSCCLVSIGLTLNFTPAQRIMAMPEILIEDHVFFLKYVLWTFRKKLKDPHEVAMKKFKEEYWNRMQDQDEELFPDEYGKHGTLDSLLFYDRSYIILLSALAAMLNDITSWLAPPICHVVPTCENTGR